MPNKERFTLFGFCFLVHAEILQYMMCDVRAHGLGTCFVVLPSNRTQFVFTVVFTHKGNCSVAKLKALKLRVVIG